MAISYLGNRGATGAYMRTTIGRRALWAASFCMIGLGSMTVTGCAIDCDQDATCHYVKHEVGGPICPEDPALGPVGSECGIWVSATFGKDQNPGTPSSPVRTIKHAIQLAQDIGPARVYACGETYDEAVALPAPISLFGGFFDCDRDIWSHEPGYKDSDHPAVLAPLMPEVFAFTLLEGDATSLVGDIQVRALDAVSPGASSIAVFAEEGSKATIRRSWLIPGNGADGEDGEPGDPDGLPAQTGLPGSKGADACTMSPGAGGLLVTLHCGDGTTSVSGGGGDGGESVANDGGNGELEPMPNPEGYGAGGKAQDPEKGTDCTPGFGGAHGLEGIHGKGGKALGKLTMDGRVVGGNGEDGTPGAPGQGGGGGGGTIGGPLCGMGFPKGGSGGGSGGTGGCAGKGGKGGQAGGSSIGIAIYKGNILLEDVQMDLGKGGAGGNGGFLQPGGFGGLPASGGLSAIPGVPGGCAGGAGGQGGKGGHGGGGRGGHSVPLVISSPEYQPDAGYSCGDSDPGIGGLGGNPAATPTSGNEGLGCKAYVVVLDEGDP